MNSINNNNIKISVVFPNYNHANFIKQSLASIIGQRTYIYECIIGDDASIDNSVEIIDNLILGYNFISFIKNKSNKGLFENSNYLIQRTEGTHIHVTAVDDFTHSEFYSNALFLLNKYPRAGLSCTGVHIIDLENNKESDYDLNLGPEDRYFSPADLAKLLDRRPINSTGCVYNKDLFLKSGGFIPELRWYTDTFINHVLAFRYGICYTPKILVSMRSHAISFSNKRNRPFKEEIKACRKVFELLQSDEYRDVYPYFVKTQCLAAFSMMPVYAVLLTPSLWDRYSLKIVWGYSWNRFKTILASRLPGFMMNFYRKFIRKIYSLHCMQI